MMSGDGGGDDGWGLLVIELSPFLAADFRLLTAAASRSCRRRAARLRQKGARMLPSKEGSP